MTRVREFCFGLIDGRCCYHGFLTAAVWCEFSTETTLSIVGESAVICFTKSSVDLLVLSGVTTFSFVLNSFTTFWSRVLFYQQFQSIGD